ncbi:MAG: hypothetical protein J0I06_10085 [Planctomycetes bacterium]|nr:hypothetical protein [Planctomycetota bacterium]
MSLPVPERAVNNGHVPLVPSPKALLTIVPAGWARSEYSIKAVDEEERAEAEAVQARRDRAAEKRLSDLQSGVREHKRCYVVPDWAGAVTADGVERAVLGVVDYWLGLEKKGRIRAKGDFLTRSDGFYWYVVTAAQLARQVYWSAKQVRRAVTRLDDEGLLRKGVHTRGGRNVALRLRLNWPVIEVAIADAWGKAEGGDADD